MFVIDKRRRVQLDWRLKKKAREEDGTTNVTVCGYTGEVSVTMYTNPLCSTGHVVLDR